MKRIIDGKRYDTETATEVAYHSSGGGRSDFNYYEETLYRTALGAWFTAGEGGARSKYSRSCGQNQLSAGEGIDVLTPAEALALLERWNEAEAIEEHFASKVTDA
jgi:hypothetical protein